MAIINPAQDPSKVLKTGDTMTGTLTIIENASVTIPLELLNNTNITGSTQLYFLELQQNGVDAFLFRRFVGANGYNDFRNTGVTNAPAINTLVAPNGTDYSDWTFDGSNTELESSVGDINLRPNLTGITDLTGNINVWSLTHTPKLRLGNSGFTQALDLYHDGTNGNISPTTGNLNIASGVVVSGNLLLSIAGNKLKIATGSNASVGTGTLVGGTVTISTTAVTANSIILLTDTGTSLTNVGSLQAPSNGITAGVSFVVKSTNVLDTSTFNWIIIN